MPDFGIELKGDREVGLRLEEFPERARAAIARRMDGLTQALLARVQGAEPERTGALRGETVATVRNTRRGVVGTVRVAGNSEADYGKAGALEYGSKGSVAVAAHAQQLGHVFGRLVAPIEVLVAAYTRRPNIAPREYLRGPLDEMHDEIVAELEEALAEAAATG
jgi:hypothetical protein